jgi:cation transport ATPase
MFINWSEYPTSKDDSTTIIKNVRIMNNTTNSRNETIQKLLLRLELWFAPLLIIVPLVVSFFFIWVWYMKGFSAGSSMYDGELLIGLLLLIGNLMFDIFFLRSLRILKKKQ